MSDEYIIQGLLRLLMGGNFTCSGYIYDSSDDSVLGSIDLIGLSTQRQLSVYGHADSYFNIKLDGQGTVTLTDTVEVVYE